MKGEFEAIPVVNAGPFEVVGAAKKFTVAANTSSPRTVTRGRASVPVTSAPSSADRALASCQNNLKQLGLVFKMFANESKGGRYPCLSSEAGRLMFANESPGMREVFPEYLLDLAILICPADTDAALAKDPAKKSDPNVMIDDHSYFYLGYAMTDEAALKAFAEAYKDRVAKGLAFDEDLAIPGGTLYMIREGIERFFITDINDPAASAKAQSEIPVLIERPGNHTPEGGNVLFMDGHVEFMTYAAVRWPMTTTTIDILKSLEAVKPPAKK